MSSIATANTQQTNKKAKPIVQYIFVRRDLAYESNEEGADAQPWPAGAVAAQVAHASVAAVAEGLQAGDPFTVSYVSAGSLPGMTKIVYGVDDLAALERVRDTWFASPCSSFEPPIVSDGDEIARKASQKGYYWMEQPENIPTAFATWPVERTNPVSKVIKNLKLSYF